MAELYCAKCGNVREFDAKHLGELMPCSKCGYKGIVGSNSNQTTTPVNNDPVDIIGITSYICIAVYVVAALTLIGSLSLLARSGNNNELNFYVGLSGLVSGTLVAATAAMLHVLIRIMDNTFWSMHYAKKTAESMVKLTRKRK